jgi:Chs5-Arf1p-binding protein BUD7/BCH1
VSGVDASSSASLAAYLNSLTYAVEDNPAWFSKSTAWKVRNGCFWCVCAVLWQRVWWADLRACVRVRAFFFVFFCSCFNAFSRVDVRVDVKIPGGVNAYVIDLRGERCVWVVLSR